MAKVTAYEAADGTLFRRQEDQLKHDDTLRLKSLVKQMASTLDASAPYMDDWNANAFSGQDGMEIAVELLLRTHPEELRTALDLTVLLDAAQVAQPQPKKKRANKEGSK